MRAVLAAAASLALCAAPLNAEPALDDVTMAVPATGFPFTAGYVADALGLWAKQ
jgi:hypothetical protein